MNINKLIHGPNVAGQSLVDRVMAAKHSLAGQGLAKSVCKATTEEISPPKKKHVDYLVQCTNEPNVSVPQMAGLLLERAQNSSWVVVYKALLTSHSLMNYGNEKFTQYLASNNCTFNVENFTDKSSPQGYDMSPFVRRYARYLNEKAFAYRQMAFDFCKVKKGKDDGILRIMEVDKLLKALPVLQGQVDKLLEFEVTKTDLNNLVIRACFMMLFKDLIRLLACYNDAIINLLAKFFEMNRKQCKEALDLYKKFVTRMEGVEKFFKVAESVGIDKGDIPDLAQAPSTLLDALEAHMKSLEGSKKGSKPGESVTSAISNLAAAAQSAGNAQTSDENTENYFFDVGYESEDFPTASAGSNNPFASSDTTTNTADEGTDLTFDPLDGSTQVAFPCDDLLGLSDPFAEIGDDGPSSEAKNPFLAASVAAYDVEDPWNSSAPFGSGVSPSHVATSNSFATDEQFAAAFDAAFDNKPSSGQPRVCPAIYLFRADMTQSVTGLATTPSGRAPSPIGLDMSKTSAPRSATPEIDFIGGLARAATPVEATGRISPAASPIHQTRQKSNEKLIKGDLDSSLALLADSLTIQPSGQVKKTEHNWTGGAEEKRLTGGSTTSVAWSHQSTATTTISSTSAAVSSAQALPTAGSSPLKDASSSLPTTTTTQQPPATEIDLFGDLLGN